jgi:hypothetical protein
MIARCSLTVLGTLSTLASFSALADGTITGVSPNPSPGVTCSLNTIKISGTGTCGTFLFELGDSTPTVHLPGNFPILVYHTYSHAGTYSLTAQGQGNCKGVVNASLQVLGPTITSIFPFSVIKPGGAVIIEGQNFGNLPGQILINFPSLHQFTGIALENIQWGDTFAAGTIPTGISGVPDQVVSFTVVAQCGAVSNSWAAKFTATRDIIALPFDQITCFSFSIGNSDRCQNMGQSNFPMECGSLPPVGTGPGSATGFYGYHASGWGGGETGNDGFNTTFNLNNGWVVDSVTDLSWAKVGNGSYATEAWTSPFGATFPGVQVNWKADACGLIVYSGDIYITGPRGVPYH